MDARDIHRRPFEACDIPVFDPSNPLHKRISKIAAEARVELISLVPKMEASAGTARGDTRQLVQNKLNQLDEIVAKLLKSQTTRYPTHKSQSLKLLELF